MRTIIAGSRTINDIQQLITAVDKCGWTITRVVSGRAKGADHLGELWAEFMNIPVDLYSADWKKHGRSAGYIRNTEMANNAEALIALWDGESRGTKHMIDIAKEKGLSVYVHYCTSS